VKIAFSMGLGLSAEGNKKLFLSYFRFGVTFFCFLLKGNLNGFL